MADGVRKKRKYSRNGCNECKRRKLKCDEGKPACWNCQHLGKTCVYERKIKFTESRSFTIDKKGVQKLVTFDAPATVATVGQPNSQPSGQWATNSVAPSVTPSHPSSHMTSTVGTVDAVPNALGYPLRKEYPRSSEAFVEQPPMLVQNPPPVSGPASSFPGSFDPSVDGSAAATAGGPAFQTPKRVLFGSEQLPPVSTGQRTELDESLFAGASTVISGLNEMIQHFDFDWQGFPYQSSASGSPPGSLGNAISPVYQTAVSADSPQDQSGSETYIKRLTQSLKNDYTTPSPLPDSSPSDNATNSNSSSSANNNSNNGSLDDSFRMDLAYPPPPISVMLSDSKDRFEYLNILNGSINENDLVMLAKYFQWSLTSSHINYLKIFVTKIHMNMVPLTTCFLDNAYINCFLFDSKESPHLLFALLAVAARYEIYQVNRSASTDLSSTKKRLRYHRKFRAYYLSSCLKSLDAIMHSRPEILSNIESLLLTIQVLACDYSGTRGSEWRAHLKGAKDLLVKYCKFRPISLELVIVWLWFYSMESLAGLTAYDGGSIHDFEELKDFLGVVRSTNANVGLALRKFGFLVGGYHVDATCNPVLQNQEDAIIDETPDGASNSDTFGQNPMGSSSVSSKGKKNKNDGPSTSSASSAEARRTEQENYITLGGHKVRKLVNFNLYNGYNDDVMDVFNDILIALESVRQFKDHPDDENVVKVLNVRGDVRNEYLVNLLAKISKARSFTIMSNRIPYMIPADSPYHPLNPKGYHYHNPTGVNVVMSGYLHNTNPQTCSEDDSLNWYSWFDLSQQLYADASLLRVLTSKHFFARDGMPIRTSMVQDVVERMLEGLRYLVQLKRDLTEEDYKTLEDYYNKGDPARDTAEEKLEQARDATLAFTADLRQQRSNNDRTSPVMDRKDAGDAGDADEADAERGPSGGTRASATAASGDAEGEDGDDIVEAEKLKIAEERELENHQEDVSAAGITGLEGSKLRFEKYLYYQFDNRLVVVQWPLFICGLCCVDPKQKLIIDSCFNALMSLGVGSAEIMLAKVKRLWRMQRLGTFDWEKQDLFDDGSDSVPFL